MEISQRIEDDVYPSRQYIYLEKSFERQHDDVSVFLLP